MGGYRRRCNYSSWVIEKLEDTDDIVVLKERTPNTDLCNQITDLEAALGEEVLKVQALTQLLLQHGVPQEQISGELERVTSNIATDFQIPTVVQGSREIYNDDLFEAENFYNATNLKEDSENLPTFKQPETDAQLLLLEFTTLESIIYSNDGSQGKYENSAHSIVLLSENIPKIVSEFTETVNNTQQFQFSVHCVKICERLIVLFRENSNVVKLIDLLKILLQVCKCRAPQDELCWIDNYLNNFDDLVQIFLQTSDENDMHVGLVSCDQLDFNLVPKNQIMKSSKVISYDYFQQINSLWRSLFEIQYMSYGLLCQSIRS